MSTKSNSAWSEFEGWVQPGNLIGWSSISAPVGAACSFPPGSALSSLRAVWVGPCVSVWVCVSLCEPVWVCVSLCESVLVCMSLCESVKVLRAKNSVNGSQDHLCGLVSAFLCESLWVFASLYQSVWVYVSPACQGQCDCESGPLVRMVPCFSCESVSVCVTLCESVSVCVTLCESL